MFLFLSGVLFSSLPSHPLPTAQTSPVTAVPARAITPDSLYYICMWEGHENKTSCARLRALLVCVFRFADSWVFRGTCAVMHNVLRSFANLKRHLLLLPFGQPMPPAFSLLPSPRAFSRPLPAAQSETPLYNRVRNRNPTSTLRRASPQS